MCFVSSRSRVSRLPLVLVCFLVEFGLLFAFGVLSFRILGSASLFIFLCSRTPRLWDVNRGMYSIAFVDLVPAATEKVSFIRSNIVWNRWKSILRAGSIRVNLNHETEM